MHIAICDDNGADRKQLERLLKRESDKRASETGVLYIDSFGNAQALLSNPLQYDAFYIDMCKTPGVQVSDIIDALAAKGVHAPIILCCSDINYREQSFPDNVLFLDKAIKTAELSESIDHALAIKAAAPTLIEIRDEDDTLYVTEDEILYATSKGRVIHIVLTDGRVIETRTTIYNLFSQWEMHENFISPTANTILNCRYIQNVGLFKAQMTDGSKHLLPKSYRAYAMQMMQEYQNQSS